MFRAGYKMRLAISAVLFVAFCSTLAFAGGAEEADLECFNRDDLEEMQYESVTDEVNALLGSGTVTVVLCMSYIEDRGTRTVVEIQIEDAKADVESADDGFLSLGSFVRVHQETSGILGRHISPYFPIQMLRLPTESSDLSSVESILLYVSKAILNVSQDEVLYQIGVPRETQH